MELIRIELQNMGLKIKLLLEILQDSTGKCTIETLTVLFLLEIYFLSSNSQNVVFCLVDIYIMLGKAFLPHLEGLSSTQLRLVTIYANRISQARSGAPIDANR